MKIPDLLPTRTERSRGHWVLFAVMPLIREIGNEGVAAVPLMRRHGQPDMHRYPTLPMAIEAATKFPAARRAGAWALNIKNGRTVQLTTDLLNLKRLLP